MGFLSLTESQVDRVQPFPGAILRKVGKSQLDRSMTGVTYVLSMRQSFFIIFDSDFNNQAVVQKTYWGDETDAIYDMVKKRCCIWKILSWINWVLYIFSTIRVSSR